MADTQTNHLGLYRIGAATDNVGVHMIEHYNANMTALDTFIAAHDIASISISGGTLTITATDGTTYTASIDAEDVNYSNSESGLTATQIQAAIDEVVTALGGKQGTLRAGDNITINGNEISATDTKDADGISFDNTDSGLTATDVQGAIDEVVTDLAEKQDTLSEGDHIDITDDTISVDTTDSIDHVSKTVTGDIISFSDGGYGFPVENLTVDVDPVQDLHGYDNPWPAGGGKNLYSLTESFTISGPGGLLNKDAFSLPAGTYTFSYETTATIDSSSATEITFWDSDASTIIFRASMPNAEHKKTFTLERDGYYISLYANKAGTYSNIQIEVGSEATSYEPYSNICPITGWTEANVTRRGKNLLNSNNDSVYNNYTITSTGGAMNGYDRITGDYICTGTQTSVIVTLNGLGEFQFAGVAFFDSNKNYLGREYVNSGRTFSAILAEGTKYIRFFMQKGTTNALTPEIFKTLKIQLEYGSTATAYEPYQGTTYNIDWQTEAGTVYGGTLDVTSGVLTVDSVGVTYDGSEDWRLHGSGSASAYTMRLDIVNNVPYYDHYFVTLISNYLRGVTNADTWGNYPAFIAISNLYLYTGINTITTVNDWKTYLASNNLQVAYRLATPQTYQLTPTEVTTLLGNNTLWADTGDSTLTYNTDTDDIIPTSEAVVDYVAPTKAVADSIKCTETTAGTYTLSATVDADGNITYAWS